MKRLLILGALFASLAAHAGDAPLHTLSRAWQPDLIDTGASAAYLSAAERALIQEINLVRTDPAAYARHFLAPQRALYQGKLLRPPGQIAIKTQEGVAALDECIKALLASKPRKALKPAKGLVLAARDHIRDQGKTGATGHGGSDGSSADDRMSRHGKWDLSSGENIDYGNDQARDIVISLLVDDGVRSRGHRRNLLDARFGFVGVAIGPHPSYDWVSVIDFAGAYE